jgi:hypothetical protein
MSAKPTAQVHKQRIHFRENAALGLQDVCEQFLPEEVPAFLLLDKDHGVYFENFYASDVGDEVTMLVRAIQQMHCGCSTVRA